RLRGDEGWNGRRRLRSVGRFSRRVSLWLLGSRPSGCASRRRRGIHRATRVGTRAGEARKDVEPAERLRGSQIQDEVDVLQTVVAELQPESGHLLVVRALLVDRLVLELAVRG